MLNAIARYEMQTESKIKVELSAVQHGTDPVSMAYTHNIRYTKNSPKRKFHDGFYTPM